jgi:hypothetical protein
MIQLVNLQLQCQHCRRLGRFSKWKKIFLFFRMHSATCNVVNLYSVGVVSRDRRIVSWYGILHFVTPKRDGIAMTALLMPYTTYLGTYDFTTIEPTNWYKSHSSVSSFRTWEQHFKNIFFTKLFQSGHHNSFNLNRTRSWMELDPSISGFWKNIVKLQKLFS